MKRVLLRIGALATVVLLGLIAILQAQRGAADQSPSAAGADLSRSASTDGNSPGTPTTRLPNNPLRIGAGLVSSEESPPQVVPSGGGRNALPDIDPVPPNVLQDSGQPSTDPFSGYPVQGQLASEAAAGGDAASGDAAPAEVAAIAGQYAAPVYGGQPPTAQVQASNPAMRRQGPAKIPEDVFATATPMFQPTAAVEVPPARSVAATDAMADVPAMPDTTRAFPETIQPTTLAGAATGRPGPRQLEGPQSPQLTIQKVAPAEVQVGKPAKFRLTVSNVGTVVAHNVQVVDQIPQDTQLAGTAPMASRGPRGELVWDLDTINPGEKQEIEVELVPQAVGEIGSVARVSFSAEASARSVVTKAELVVKTSAPERVLIGEQMTLTIEVSNPGSGTASGVVLEEHIPAGLQHSEGKDLEYALGDLRPGESRKLELSLLASQPGRVVNTLVARGDGNLQCEDRLELEVVAPQLQVAMDGPKRRFLERKATYKLLVHNPGTAPAKEVELVAYLPGGLKFVSADNYGHYVAADRSVHWQLDELPSQEQGKVELVTMPVEAGQHRIRLQGTATRGLSDETEQPVLVEGIAAIMFEVVDVNDPVEQGGETTYEIRVLNQGSKAATNVELSVELPRELRLVSAEGPPGARHAPNGNLVVFSPLARLAPKADTTYRVRVQGIQPGDLRTRVHLRTAEMQTPVMKEESTRVYSDQ